MEKHNISSPAVIMESIGITEFGDLPGGLYFYGVSAVVGGKESYPHVIQVYARYKENSVILKWNSVKDAEEYKVYRGRSMDKFDEYFTVYEQNYFHDNGLWEPNILS